MPEERGFNSRIKPQDVFNLLQEKSTRINDHGFEESLPEGILWGITHEIYAMIRRAVRYEVDKKEEKSKWPK